MSKLHELADLGQAIWLDYIRRSFITSGDLQALVDQGVRGVTSNPSIFEKYKNSDFSLLAILVEAAVLSILFIILPLYLFKRSGLHDPGKFQTGHGDGQLPFEIGFLISSGVSDL